MRPNSLSGMPRGMNVFNDLLESCISIAGVLRLVGNVPMTDLSEMLLGSAIDDLLDALAGVTTAAPSVGDTFDLDAGEMQINPDRPMWLARVCADDDVVDSLEARGYFDQFDTTAQDRARDALESIDGAEVEVHHIGLGPLTPVGIVDLVATAVQIALTGRAHTPWIDAYPVVLDATHRRADA
ncbi:hypothetical protein [Cellulomonas dongxiuzhuiae]|uniref:hypothetical protein n=1 Tax=Cellulomonas dongxiuzhuiae TaxID=2819979 RepID=UPI001AAF5EE5|nr:hypothetical protein [Cellulomonas dongxiuzhuiae]MBO3090021.1 hypothetical protein [Cellulomonas dongxiuzhuiae]